MQEMRVLAMGSLRRRLEVEREVFAISRKGLKAPCVL